MNLKPQPCPALSIAPDITEAGQNVGKRKSHEPPPSSSPLSGRTGGLCIPFLRKSPSHPTSYARPSLRPLPPTAPWQEGWDYARGAKPQLLLSQLCSTPPEANSLLGRWDGKAAYHPFTFGCSLPVSFQESRIDAKRLVRRCSL